MTNKFVVLAMGIFINAPCMLYVGNEHADAYDTSSITLETSRLLHYLDNDHPIPKALKIEDFNEIDDIDEPMPEMQVLHPEHAITAGSLALSAGITTYLIADKHNSSMRFVDPFSAAAGLKILEAGSATLATIFTFGGVYWVLRNFFTSDLKHKLEELKRSQNARLELLTTRFDDERRTTNTRIAELTALSVQSNNRLERVLALLLQEKPDTEEIKELLQQNKAAQQKLGSLSGQDKKPHKNPFTRILGKFFHKGSHS